MAGVNKAIVLGNLGRDPEVRHSPSGAVICNLAIATSRAWKDKESGERREETEWHRVVLYNRLAEIAGEYLAKGRQVYIEGRLQTRKWQDKEGQDRWTTEIVAESLQLLGGRDSDGGAGSEGRGGYGAPQRQAQREPQRQAPAQGGRNTVPDQFDDDIPYINPYRGRLSFVV